jgi:hypothetical protein
LPLFSHELKLIPSLRNESMDSADDSSSSFLQRPINSSRERAAMETPKRFSVATSMGRPLRSSPRGNRTLCPVILRKRANMSISV